MECALFPDCFYLDPVVSNSELSLSLQEFQETFDSLNAFADFPYLEPVDFGISDSIPSQVQCAPSRPSGFEANFDLTFWDGNFPSFYENSSSTIRISAESLPVIDTPPLAAELHLEKGNGSEMGELGQVMVEAAEGENGHERISIEGRQRSGSIEFEEISKYFYVPITQAAKEMKVGLTVLKKRCRELGISRWPHRKMKSLNSLIHNVQELRRGDGEGGEISLRKEEIEKLEEHKRLMEKMPEMQLTEDTKKLRQACFKANYKKRRLMALTAGVQ